MSELIPTPSAGDGKRGQLEYDGKRGQSLVGAARGQKWDSTSSPEVSRASLFPKLEREWEDMMTVTSGRKCFELYSYSSRGGSSLRMFVDFLVLKTGWYSSKCVLTWKVQDTTCNRLLFLLSPSMRTTDATECGLWATASAGKVTESGEIVDGEGNPWTGTGKPHSKKTGKPIQTALTDQVKIWPTPRAGMTGNPTPARVNDKNNNLETMIARQMYPTPKGSQGGQETGKTSTTGVNLVTAVKLLPTPSASMVMEEDMAQAQYAGSDPLRPRPQYKDAKLWPTVRASEWKGAPGVECMAERNKHPRGKSLSEEVAKIQLLPTPTVPGPHQVGTIAEWGGSKNPLRTPETMRLQGGSLNPTWVEWLMGFPEGWTDLEHSETRSSRKSPK